jgi:hypothetical protein
VSDIEILREALAIVERRAQGLAWNKERPWRTATHVWEERRVPTVDLHDLGRKLALLTIDTLAELGPELSAGSVRIVVGRGRHSLTGPVIPGLAADRLREHCQESGWQFHADGAARLMWIFDPDRAPPAARGALPWWIWAWLAVVVALAVMVCGARLSP